MKFLEKVKEWIGSFPPMIIFILLGISCLRYFESQTSDTQQIKTQIKQIGKEHPGDNEMQSYWLFRD